MSHLFFLNIRMQLNENNADDLFFYLILMKRIKQNMRSVLFHCRASILSIMLYFICVIGLLLIHLFYFISLQLDE